MNKPLNLQKPFVTKELRLANITFQKDLSELIETHRGSWTAYVGRERKGIAADRDSLFRKFKREYDAGILLLAKIRERPTSESMAF